MDIIQMHIQFFKCMFNLSNWLLLKLTVALTDKRAVLRLAKNPAHHRQDETTSVTVQPGTVTKQHNQVASFNFW